MNRHSKCLSLPIPTTTTLIPGTLFSLFFKVGRSSHLPRSKTSGQFHSAKGATVESIGSLIGSRDWQKSGQQEHRVGEAEYKAAQAQGYVEGVTDRLAGKTDIIVGAVTGDKTQQTEGKLIIFACLEIKLNQCFGRQRPA